MGARPQPWAGANVRSEENLCVKRVLEAKHAAGDALLSVDCARMERHARVAAMCRKTFRWAASCRPGRTSSVAACAGCAVSTAPRCSTRDNA
jgi:hypothetical protein